MSHPLPFPNNGTESDVFLIGGRNYSDHDFGYPCCMPGRITIDGLAIVDGNPPDNYRGPKIFGEFNRLYTSEEYKEAYPYIITEEVSIKNMTAKSGKQYYISDNPFMFRNVKITDFI